MVTEHDDFSGCLGFEPRRDEFPDGGEEFGGTDDLAYSVNLYKLTRGEEVTYVYLLYCLRIVGRGHVAGRVQQLPQPPKGRHADVGQVDDVDRGRCDLSLQLATKRLHKLRHVLGGQKDF